MSAYVIATQNRNPNTGSVIPPIAGDILTADGNGNSSWQPPIQGGQSSAVSLSDAGFPTGPNSASLVVGSSGPNMTIRQVAGSSNISIVQGIDAIRLTLASNQTGVNAIAGSGKAILVLSEPDVVSVGDAQLAWDQQPRSSWNTPLASAGVIGTAAGSYIISPEEIKNINENGFVTGSDGATTFVAAAGWVEAEYSGAVYVPGSVTAVGARNIYLFPYVGDGAPPATPAARYTTINLPVGTGAISDANPVPEANCSFEAKAQVYMLPGQKVRLAAILGGDFADAPIVSNICFNAVALLTRKA